MPDYARFQRALSGVALPAILVDLDAVDANLDTLLAAAGGRVPLRLASKSLRVPALMRYLLDRRPDDLRGLLTYRPAETRLLAEQGFHDLLLAYPVASPAEAVDLAIAATHTRVTVVVDEVAHLELLTQAAQGAGTTLGICLDIDVALHPGALGAEAHLGVLRSPLRTPAQAVALARHAKRLPGLRLDSVMAYEAQVAGLSDAVSPWMSPAIALLKRRSIRHAARVREQVVAALKAAGHAITLVNGGGTGSVHSTSQDPTITEVAAGSGILCPHLFDGYTGLDLRPAIFQAIRVVRRPNAQHVTCAGGGYIASGPPGADRSPKVWAPDGLTPVHAEGFGEVQTPLRRSQGCRALNLGDPVILRPAKAGESMERFSEVQLLRGDRIVEVVPTLRGLAHTSP